MPLICCWKSMRSVGRNNGRWSVASVQGPVVRGQGAVVRGQGTVATAEYAWEECPRMAIRSYRDLIVWQKAMDLVAMVYTVSKGFPREEMYGLTSQVRRAVVSIPSNIAEGQGRNSTREFRNHLSMAYGSLQEVETQILVAERLGYLNADTTRATLRQASEVGRMINALSSALLKKLATTTRK
ncbi:MAG: four helix bundle protein [Desulfatibacillaceae bacterium]